ncbi:uncharacterized protein AB675_2247 [Cyphellophora attinorum]|uniref:Uncharacterized protein n=1 Tax=Cyphellophora attinorum TaxID=1664694 RepID=A0A0N1NVK5_9EURO|nr:uncharacterized protein AB675_2247 [Phialophora attinorum]KPI34896.1 hypothetical protein AB675_2247 [Phialophora attinorum]
MSAFARNWVNVLMRCIQGKAHLEQQFDVRPTLPRADTEGVDPLSHREEPPPNHPASTHEPHDTGLQAEQHSHDTRTRRGAVIEDGLQDQPSFQPPPSESDYVEAKSDQHARPSLPVLNDPELAQTELKRVFTEAKHNSNWFVLLCRRLLSRSPIGHGVTNGLGFAASLPTVLASAALHHYDTGFEQNKDLYVLEYTYREFHLRASKLCQFDNIGSLKKHLISTTQPCDLRLISCNNRESLDHLVHDFGINNISHEGGEKSVREWMRADASSRRAAGKAMKWRPSYDDTRKMICSAFALDFGKVLVPNSSNSWSRNKEADADLAESTHPQRVAVYMQRKAATVTTSNAEAGGLRVMPSGTTGASHPYAFRSVGIDKLRGLEISNSDPSAAICEAMQFIILHVTSGVYRLWNQQLHLLDEPHSELEDHIFSQPSDPSRAREVWRMSQRLHDMSKLLERHKSIIEFVQDDFLPFAELPYVEDEAKEAKWLDRIIEEFQDLSATIRADYVDTMERMIDLIGFFGMNVDTFQPVAPSMKWYFIAAAPLLVSVVAFWFSVRTFAPASKRADLAMEMTETAAPWSTRAAASGRHDATGPGEDGSDFSSRKHWRWRPEGWGGW